jgi:hypothetical protein
MYADCRTLWRPKAGRSQEEYEDAYWPRRDGRYVAGTGQMRFAVADGATESSFAGRWARQLAFIYCQPGTPPPTDVEGFRQKIDRQSAKWMQHVFAKPLAWNFLAKAQRGAFATLSGVTFAGDGRWDALAIGDSCLFQIRRNELLRAWPPMAADAFGFHPMLLCSIAAQNDALWAGLEQCSTSGTWEAGDVFLLMTDAIAKWFVQKIADGGRPWTSLLDAAASAQSFAEWIDALRDAGAMPNDDVTLLQISFAEA